ncbi:MAG: xanthine dehydrogenase family protein subunit M [Alphaproteobacteria bacterium]|nr:xanthine dehydrogenase family protein subunit M [Alphaproteobacteria bacterium]
MKPAPFRYVRARSVDDAVAALARDSEAKVLAGGQSLIAMMNVRAAKPETLVDINALSGLDYIKVKDGGLAIGALTRHETVKNSPLVAEHCPLLAEAYHWIAHRAVRNRGTYGGNLCHADPASENPAVALVAGATMVLKSAKGERAVPAAEFFKGIYQTAARQDELLVEVRIPSRPKGQGWGFAEVSPRKGDFAMTAVACTLELAGANVKAARIAYTGIADRAMRFAAVEASVAGKTASEETFAAAGAAARKAIDPSSDFHADEAMRRDLADTLTRRALSMAKTRCA